MTFTQAVRVCLKDKYCSFRGRASRSEFWWFMLCIGLINLAANIVLSPLPPETAMGLNFLVSPAPRPPPHGETARRLHHRHLAAGPLQVPIPRPPFGLLGRGAPGGNAGPVSALLSLSMCICYLAILSLPGTAGPNRFGPDPLAAKNTGD